VYKLQYKVSRDTKYIKGWNKMAKTSKGTPSQFEKKQTVTATTTSALPTATVLLGEGGGDTTSITNGEIQYVGSLSLQVNESNLISDFQFDWSQVNQENYDDQTLTRNESVFSVPTLYTNLMSGEYATGVTPFRIQYLYASNENNFFSSWEHGTIRPLFAYGSENGASSYFKFSITYEVDELAVLEEKFARGSFEDKLLEAIGNIANNLNNQLNLDPKNQNLDFQKSKNKMINFKNLSNFSSKQETTIATETIVNSTTTSVITNGGY